jgi:hypothetical protein
MALYALGLNHATAPLNGCITSIGCPTHLG